MRRFLLSLTCAGLLGAPFSSALAAPPPNHTEIPRGSVILREDTACEVSLLNQQIMALNTEVRYLATQSLDSTAYVPQLAGEIATGG